MKTVRMY